MTHQQEEMLKDIHTALVGTKYGQEGLIAKAARHEKWIRRQDKNIYMVFGGCAAIGIIFKAVEIFMK